MSASKNPVEHIVVLMMENHSYDHLLGYLPHGHGLTGKEYNPVDPASPASEKVYVSNRAGYVMAINPFNDVVNVETQLFGEAGHVVHPAPMSGFVKAQIKRAKGDVEDGKKIMECLDPARIPALTTLAREFVLCDHWHASVPGPTLPNRFFTHAATSDGVSRDDAVHAYTMRSIFDALSDQAITWRVYYGDIPQCILFQRLHNRLDHFKRFDAFHEDLERGEMAAYTFVEPRYIEFFPWKATDQHPPHDIKLGEYLIAEVYDALRASRFWTKSLLVVLYDEHGGFFDRVPPPGQVPNPDGKVATDPPFDFTRLGVRVPAVLVSPWVEKGQIDSTVYEHASLLATIRDMFGLGASLTARDRAANTFAKNLSRTTPRSDTPMTLPVPGEADEIRHHRELLRAGPAERELPAAPGRGQGSQSPLTPLQHSLMELADWLNEEALADVPALAGKVLQEHEAALHVHAALARVLARAREELA